MTLVRFLLTVHDACLQSLPKDCGYGWNRFGNMCIKLVEYDMNWNDAKTHCEGEAADLLAVYNSSVHNFVIGKHFRMLIAYFKSSLFD